MLQNCTCVKPYFKVYTIVDGKIAFHHMSARFIYKHIYSLSLQSGALIYFSLKAINTT